MDLPKPPGVKQQGTDFRIQEWSTALLTHCSERQTSTGPAVLMCSGVPMALLPRNKMSSEVSSWVVSHLMDAFYYLDSRTSRPVVSYFSNAVSVW